MPPAVLSYFHSSFDQWLTTVADPLYWCFVAALSVIQLVLPADRTQRRPAPALVEDAVWFALATALQVTVVGAVTSLLDKAYGHATGGFGVDLTPYLGVWGVAVVAFVLTDLFTWVTHWIHHHVPVLWYFHAVHHSQTNMNALTDNREHVVETVVSAALAYVPARLLGLDSDTATKLAFAAVYLQAFIHANIRTNLGMLRYVFVSPQFHRVHHSIDPEHYNSNYATVFAFWDLLFRTAHRDSTSYPETGIDDAAFPRVTGWNPLRIVAVWARQTAYPFTLVALRRHAYAGNSRGVREGSLSFLHRTDDILPVH